MRNKLLAILICVMLSCLGLFGLTACNPAHQHKYTLIVVDPTCENQGYTAQQCECGDKIVSEYVDAIGHAYGEYVSDENASCETNCTETAICENCGEHDVRIIPGTALGHDYGDWIANNDGTHFKICRRDNSHELVEDCSGGFGNCAERAICPSCGSEYGELAHVFLHYVSNNDATCLANGTETAICDYCEQVYDTREQLNSKLPHTFVNYISNGDATCLANGTETAKCNNCNETDTREVADSKLPHTFNNYVSDNNATYEADGTKTSKCDTCDETDTIVDEGSRLQSKITFNSFTVDGQNVYGVVNSSTDKIDFDDEILASGKAQFIVSYDIEGEAKVRNNVLSLSFGENNVVYVTQIIEEERTVYTVTVKRKFAYTVAFNSDGGSAVESQTVDEGELLVVPTAPIKVGYHFDCWDYDFSQAVTENITINAVWKAIFKVENGSITALTTYGKTLSEIDIPGAIDGVEIIGVGSNAFSGSTYYNNKDNWSNGALRIGKYLIKVDTSTSGIFYLDEEVEIIADKAFSFCYLLNTIVIPKGLKIIGAKAFEYCLSLKTIHYLASESDWNSVSKGNSWGNNDIVTFKDASLESSVITLNGEDFIGDTIVLEIPSSTTIDVKYNGVSADKMILSGYQGFVTLSNNVLTTIEEPSSFDLTILFSIGNKNFTFTVPVSIVYPIGVIPTPVDYDASSGQLIDTRFNGQKIVSVSFDGNELVKGEGYTVDENGYLTSIYGKKSATDDKNGIPYKINDGNDLIAGKLVIVTENDVFTYIKVNYFTRIIDNYDELKASLQINYTINQGGTSENGIVYNTHTDGKEYVYNAGIYKLGANIDMYNAETREYLAIDYSSITITNKDYYGQPYYDSSVILGGFTGVFDGDGYVISNFKPSKYGMFGILATAGSGLTAGANIKNVAFTNVLTTSADLNCPVIAAQMYNSDTIAQNISNVYVSYSASATDMYGLVHQPSGVLNMNNVYVVNETMYNAIDEGLKDNYYGIELQEGVTYRNVFPRGVNTAGIHEFSSSLFVSIRNMKNIGSSYINNVLVASPNLISYNNNFDFAMQGVYSVQHVSRTYTFSNHFYSRITCSPRDEAYYYCSNCGYYYATAECSRCGADAVLSSQSRRTSSKARSFGFAGNEVTSTVPVIKGFAPSIIKDLATAPYKTGSGALINTFSTLGASGKPGYVCDTCGKHISLIKDSKCYDENCNGTMSVAISVKNGLTYEDYNLVWASPYAYEWTLYDLTARASTNIISDTNAIVRFMGVTRYNTASEINEKADLSSFASSKVWTVDENGLSWASLVA